MLIDRTQEIAEFIIEATAHPTTSSDLRNEFLAKFPEPTANEWYAGYELAFELAKEEPFASRIDTVFDVLMGDDEDAVLGSLVSEFSA